MVDRCEPPEALRKARGMECYIEYDEPDVAGGVSWFVAEWSDGYWYEAGTEISRSPEEAAELGWRYLASVPAPDAVAALCKAAWAIFEGCEHMPAAHVAGVDMAARWTSRRAPTSEELTALRAALAEKEKNDGQ